MSWSKLYSGPEPQRVNKWLAQEGVCSRREAEALIADGLVSIDGARVDDVGRKIEPGQKLTLSDKAQRKLDAAFTAVLNKPVGYVSSQPETGQTPAARLITGANLIGAASVPAKDASLAPLGRLDQDSRGLLLLSDDGVLAKAVIGPASRLDKEYLVRVDGKLNDKKLTLLRHGLSLDGKALKPAKINVVEDQRLRFTLSEGRNRQIRRMCEAVDLGVTDLLRLRIGPLKLGDLHEGKWRALTPQERKALIAQS
ncbi:tRNA pseudouridine synthase A [alpha proteobacterium U9-1i]|nr:tRNA pseudouridine synthase A [alpha proteobacterium U9-1i]